MQSYKFIPLLLVLLAAVSTIGCSPSRLQVDSEWESEVLRNQPFKKIIIVGLSPRFNGRCEFERFLRTQIRSASTMAISSGKKIIS